MGGFSGESGVRVLLHASVEKAPGGISNLDGQFGRTLENLARTIQVELHDFGNRLINDTDIRIPIQYRGSESGPERETGLRSIGRASGAEQVVLQRLAEL